MPYRIPLCYSAIFRFHASFKGIIYRAVYVKWTAMQIIEIPLNLYRMLLLCLQHKIDGEFDFPFWINRNASLISHGKKFHLRSNSIPNAILYTHNFKEIYDRTLFDQTWTKGNWFTFETSLRIRNVINMLEKIFTEKAFKYSCVVCWAQLQTYRLQMNRFHISRHTSKWHKKLATTNAS